MPRKRKTRKLPGAPDNASRPGKAAPRGAPFKKGNTLGLPTRYKPGQTGNPGGVPKDVREFRELVRARIPVMLARLDDVLHHGTEEGVIKAIREVNVNAFPRSIEVGGPDGGPMRITYDDVRLKLNDLAAKALAKKEAAQAEPDGGTEDDDADDGGDRADKD